MFIRLDGAFDHLQQIRDTPIIAGGKTLKLADVATVEQEVDPATFLIRNQGEPALLGVVMREGWMVWRWGKRWTPKRPASIRACRSACR